MRKHKIKYTEESTGQIKIMPDFLANADDLTMQEETVKISLLRYFFYRLHKYLSPMLKVFKHI
jgi:hypothetical protein